MRDNDEGDGAKKAQLLLTNLHAKNPRTGAAGSRTPPANGTDVSKAPRGPARTVDTSETHERAWTKRIDFRTNLRLGVRSRRSLAILSRGEPTEISPEICCDFLKFTATSARRSAVAVAGV